MNRLPMLERSGGALAAALGHDPTMSAALENVVAGVWMPDTLDPALTELVLARICQLLRHPRSFTSEHSTTEKVDAVASWPTSSLFDEREKAALQLTELMVMDAKAVDDDAVELFRSVAGDAATMGLVVAIAVLDQQVRLEVAMTEEGDD